MGARDETLEIPDSVRRIVDERDAGFCRVCGSFQGERRAIHHILYGGDTQGMGGRRKHDPDAMISICWLPSTPDCHTKVHSRKAYWQPILLATIKRPGTTANQIARWQERTRRAQGARDRQQRTHRPVTHLGHLG